MACLKITLNFSLNRNLEFYSKENSNNMQDLM